MKLLTYSLVFPPPDNALCNLDAANDLLLNNPFLCKITKHQKHYYLSCFIFHMINLNIKFIKYKIKISLQKNSYSKLNYGNVKLVKLWVNVKLNENMNWRRNL